VARGLNSSEEIFVATIAPGLVDVHHHILPKIYTNVVADRIGTQGLFTSAEWSAERSLESMDRNGIGASVTSISSPGFWFGNVAETRKLVRACNEFSAALRLDHPTRFGMFAHLPLPDIDASLTEIEIAFDTLGADGVAVATNYDGKYPGEAHFRPVFEELNRRKAVVFFHPNPPTYGTLPAGFPAPTLEFPFETTRAIGSLLYGGILARTHDISFIFPHAGGALPYLADRLARMAMKPEFEKHTPNGVLPELERLYFDVALSANKRVFGAMLNLVEPTNVLFGSDYPHAGEAAMAATVQSLTLLGLEKRDVEAIQRENAIRLFARFRTCSA
jgi:predicted TIM-barrel fold metal-dependent hydrolase